MVATRSKNEPVILSDIIIAIISLLGEGNVFPSSRSKLYQIFYNLSQKFTVLFNDFVFDTSKIYPKCETIDIAVDRMVGGRMVEWILDGDYVITPTLIETGEKIIILLGRKKRKFMRHAAKEFKKMFEPSLANWR